jgi:signal transduction histidine kinase
MAVIHDLAVNHGSSQSPEARIDAAPESIMEHTEFFSLRSPEMRTPLATIKGFAQTLIAHWDAIPEDRRRKHVEQILRSTVRLERLVGDLSLAARLVDGISLEPRGGRRAVPGYWRGAGAVPQSLPPGRPAGLRPCTCGPTASACCRFW